MRKNEQLKVNDIVLTAMANTPNPADIWQYPKNNYAIVQPMCMRHLIITF